MSGKFAVPFLYFEDKYSEYPTGRGALVCRKLLLHFPLRVVRACLPGQETSPVSAKLPEEIFKTISSKPCDRLASARIEILWKMCMLK